MSGGIVSEGVLVVRRIELKMGPENCALTVSWISLEACDSAIISASCELALVVKGSLRVKRTRPAWMPVMAQPAALSVFDPSVKMQRVCHPSLEPSQMRCWAIRDFLSGLEQASELMNSLPAKGRDMRTGW